MPGPSRSSGSHSTRRCSSSEPRHRDWSRCSHRQSQPGYDAVSFFLLFSTACAVYISYIIIARDIFSAGAMLSTSRSDFDLWNGGGHPPFPLCRLRYAATVPSGIVSVGSSEARAEPKYGSAFESTWSELRTETPRREPPIAPPEPARIYTVCHLYQSDAYDDPHR